MGQKLSELRGLLTTMDGEENINELAGKKFHLADQDDGSSTASSLNGNDSDHFESIYSTATDGAGGSDEVNGNVVAVEPSYEPRQCHDGSCSCPVKSTGARRRAKDSTAVHSNSLKRNTLRTMSLMNGKRSRGKMARAKEAGTTKKRNTWVLKFNCAKLKAGSSSTCLESDIPETHIICDSCVCTGYRRTEEHHLGAGVVFEADTHPREAARLEASAVAEEASAAVVPQRSNPVIDLSKFNPEDFPIEDCDERARLERAREIAEGVEPPPGFQPRQHIQLVCPPELTLDNLTMLFQTHLGLHTAALTALSQIDMTLPVAVQRMVHTQVDYVHCLVPDLLQITSCSFYWGKMDRYEAERLLEGRPEGTFLLRDSAQEEFLFSVTFRKYGRSLHARIEQWNHRFSFDCHDPGVFASATVCGLIEHYKDPSCCMFFEPMLTIPLHRSFPFPLQHLCRAAVCSRTNYDSINQLHLPKVLKSYLKEYHYKQRVRIRRFDTEL